MDETFLFDCLDSQPLICLSELQNDPLAQFVLQENNRQEVRQQSLEEEAEQNEESERNPADMLFTGTEDPNDNQKRSSNTIFKTSLSQFRKTILTFIDKNKNLQFVKVIINDIYKHKNFSVFPKLLEIVRALSLTSQVSQSWAVRIKKLIHKKEQQNKFTKSRLEALKKTIDQMTEALNQDQFEESFNKYWGKFRQHQKYERSKKQVKDFKEQFERILNEKIQSFKEKGTGLKRKRGRKPKNYQEDPMERLSHRNERAC